MKILIIRFSSIGDIIQALASVEFLREKFPKAEIHWVVRSDFADLVKFNPNIKRTYTLDRKEGLFGLKKLIEQLKAENYTHIYDAHNNVRSHLIAHAICGLILRKNFVRRSKDRIKRFLLFKMRMNLYPKGLTALDTYIDPLAKWGIAKHNLKTTQLIIPKEVSAKVRKEIPFKKFVALIPSAAWELKRWPQEYWKKLILSMPDENFVILGGPNDKDLDNIAHPGQKNVLNMRGKFSLIESCAAVSFAHIAVGCDTGLSHAADQLAVPIVFITGPTAFGLPSRLTSYSMEVDLPCRPCTKDGSGTCKNTVYKKCMYDIQPHIVKQKIEHHV